MRALITGAAGQLGSDLARLLPEAVAASRRQLDIADPEAVEVWLERVRPEVVWNCAAYNAVDRAEQEPELALRVNRDGPARLAAACARHKVRLVHFSTNFVFSGEADAAYSERDRPDPRSVYAVSKLAGEQAVLSRLPEALVIRSSGLYGVVGSAVKGGSFPERVIRRARETGKLRMVGDQRLNPTFTADLAAGSLAALDAGCQGVLHLVAAGCCSWLELSREALRLAGVEAEIESVSTAELAAPAARPLNGCLISVHRPPLRDWRAALADWWQVFRSVAGSGSSAS